MAGGAARPIGQDNAIPAGESPSQVRSASFVTEPGAPMGRRPPLDLYDLQAA
jgi:hypothetical protein